MTIQLESIFDLITVKPSGTSPDTPECLDKDGRVTFLPDDPTNPRSWSVRLKVYITAVNMLMVLNATFASSAPTANVVSVSEHFKISTVVANLVTTLFLLGYCAGPLFWAPMCELYGRRWLFIASMTGYFAFNFLCAFTPTFGGLLVGRFISGAFASGALTIAPAVSADLWDNLPRGNVIAVFIVVSFAGPACAPVSSGFLELKKNWRWTYYQLLWLVAASLALIVTCPETYGPLLLARKARRMQKIAGCEGARPPASMENLTPKRVFQTALTRPWILLLDPLCFWTTIYMSFVYMVEYMIFAIYPVIFQRKRRWNAGVGQLPFLGMVLGTIVAACIIFAETAIMQKRKKQGKGTGYRPEARMRIGMIGAVAFAVCIFWIAWTGQYNSIHWTVPTIAGVFLSMSIGLLFFAIFNYLIDSYLMFAASAVAANTICRSALAAASPLFTPQMFDNLGVGGAGSLLGGLAAVMAPIPFVFYKYGEALRARSKHASVSIAFANKVDAVATRPPAGSDSEQDAVADQVDDDKADDGDVEKGSNKGYDEDDEVRLGNMGR